MFSVYFFSSFFQHGHIFYVLGWGDGSYIPGKTSLELTNPLRRDTSTVPAFGYTVIRFVNDNPGLWALHCHIDWHMEAGLMVQFLSLPDKIKVRKAKICVCGKRNEMLRAGQLASSELRSFV